MLAGEMQMYFDLPVYIVGCFFLYSKIIMPTLDGKLRELEKNPFKCTKTFNFCSAKVTGIWSTEIEAPLLHVYSIYGFEDEMKPK